MSKWRHIKAFLLFPFQGIFVIPIILILFVSELHIGWSFPSPYNLLPLVLGGFIIFLGLYLIIKTDYMFAKLGKGTLCPWDPTQNLVVSGVYRYVRNPMVIGVALTVLGEAILFGSVALGITFLVVILGNHYLFIKHEEPDLTHRYGDPYLLYLQNVPRWIPRLRPWTGLSGETKSDLSEIEND